MAQDGQEMLELLRFELKFVEDGAQNCRNAVAAGAVCCSVVVFVDCSVFSFLLQPASSSNGLNAGTLAAIIQLLLPFMMSAI
jgi:hypothetical protein